MKYKTLIEKMTLAEKASLMSGENFWNTKAIERLGVPSIMLTDGPHGLRKQAGKADHLGLNKSVAATCYPTAATLANSWDRELIAEMGTYLAKECISEDVNVILGPGLNIKRNPLGGRNFEYFSEDPYLTGELAAAMVQGIQSQGVGACAKHFAVNSQEHMRMTIDEIVDERSLREIYLEGFRKVITQSQPKVIMSSYNKVNGTFANENQHLMNDILYDEWQYKGVMVTDWGGNNDRVAGLKAKNQLEMPSTNGITDQEIITAVENGQLEESIVDDAVDHLLELIFTSQAINDKQISIDYEVHHEKAVEIAKQSIVLLKNDAGILPIADQRKVAVIGEFAAKPRYQGAGSSLINPTKLPNALEVLQHSSINISGYAQGFKRMGGKINGLLQEAVRLAEHAETVLLFVGLDESSEAEGVDRKNLRLPENQLAVIEAVTKVNPNVVVIIAGGGVIEMPFAQKVKGILHTYLPGQGGAEALREILTGNENPSGKTSETFPLHYEDTPSAPFYPGKEATAEHREGLFIGYRYFTTVEKPVLFPFGYGLSYTTFEYQNLIIDGATVSFDVTNTGEIAGKEIAQLYIEKKDTQIFRAKKELKDFQKVYLKPGETKTITFELDPHDFEYFGIKENSWQTEAGQYDIQIGSSVEAIHLNETITIDGKQVIDEYTPNEFPDYFAGKVQQVTDHEFKELLGYQPPEKLWDPQKPLGMNDTIAQARYKHWLGKATYGLVAIIRDGFMLFKNPIWSNNMYFVINMPFRQIERFTGGKISNKMVKRYLKIINKEKRNINK
ncbi:beta-glucosidase family protein [Enterococcus termitis]|uniref:Glycosyl hydrolase n=1 Tax=Enterococcus termitis TaxID=332950 RepID=A0A1E5GHW8_9ENTE|nr:glycoside hydrolase family 3 C-terminal domain-containing protein [Enterococcus termitis]OEG12257.1 glycosyl hydrolase [Enterococcus termitis]OJG98930.1 thermostable beta-glucosidase B [Enterococcus termitis]